MNPRITVYSCRRKIMVKGSVRRNAVAFAEPFGRVDGNYTIKPGPAAASLFCAHVYKGVLAHPESGG